ncbi:type II toxin-antitoxin system RelE/ParE family toxin, partial [Pseudomonas aeruginosa]|uniref:type II toxin-antitoxin system RelE/ParE family toxin n=1 Tax=Pseudomonas aeruginosa TaxID=287 RepID=UPI0031B71465
VRHESRRRPALEAVATDPQQVGSISREELGAGLRSIHLVYCRSMPNVGKVVRPRHFVFYRVATDQVLEVVRVLHDSMDLDQHLPRNR